MKHLQLKHVLMCLLVTTLSAIISCGDTASTEDTDDSLSAAMSTDAMSTPLLAHAEAVITGTKADTAVDGRASFDVDNGKVKMMLDVNYT